MNLIRNRATSLLGAGLLAGGALVAMVSPAQATPVLSSATITVCAQGNYTAYAKIVATDGSVSMDLSKVAQGKCLTTVADFILNDPHATIDVYVFGLYNISHKGFDVCHYGGAAESIDANTSATFDAAGTTTSPYLAGNLEVGGCAPQLCSGM